MKCKRDGCDKNVTRGGRAVYCTDACRVKVNDRKYVEAHREKVNELRRFRYKNDPVVRAGRLTSNKRYRKVNIDKLNKYVSDYYKTCPEKRRIKNRKYKAVKRGITHEAYQNNYIFERDDWMCQICGRKINKRLQYPNPLSASVDHIVPLSKGGNDSPVNVQASHLRCNIGKHAQNKGQLRLFG